MTASYLEATEDLRGEAPDERQRRALKVIRLDVLMSS